MWKEHKFSSQVSLDSSSCSPDWSSCLHSPNARITRMLHHSSGRGRNPQLCACLAIFFLTSPFHAIYLMSSSGKKMACCSILSPRRPVGPAYPLHLGETCSCHITMGKQLRLESLFWIRGCLGIPGLHLCCISLMPTHTRCCENNPERVSLGVSGPCADI